MLHYYVLRSPLRDESRQSHVEPIKLWYVQIRPSRCTFIVCNALFKRGGLMERLPGGGISSVYNTDDK